MKPTADESAKLKQEFKEYFYLNGYNFPLSARLQQERDKFPLEWAEACQEYEECGLSQGDFETALNLDPKLRF